MQSSWKVALRLLVFCYHPSVLDEGRVIVIRVVGETREGGHDGGGRRQKIIFTCRCGRCRIISNVMMMIRRSDEQDGLLLATGFGWLRRP
jgi:hypothetical protein